MEEIKSLPIKVKDIINTIGDYYRSEMDYGECSVGCGIVNGHRQYAHKYFYVSIHYHQFQDNGQYSSMYSFIAAVQKQLKEIEQELLKKHIVFIKDTEWAECGGTDCWGIPRRESIECVKGFVHITPAKSFIELQKWLQKKAQFTLNITDLYTCDVCQKRDSKSYDGHTYYAGDENYCKKVLNRLKGLYKNGNKVVANLETDEWVESGDYEYERYGRKRVCLSVTISTPTGRNAQRIVA